MNEDPLCIKVVVVGDDVVSTKQINLKSQLLATYSSSLFPRDGIPDACDSYRIPRTIKGQPVILELIDTSGKVDRDRVKAYSNTNLFVLAFSVVDYKSFEHISTMWCPEVIRCCPGVPFILVGLNTLKRNKPNIITKLLYQGSTVVSTDMGEELKKNIQAVAYRECDARYRVGITEMVDTALNVAWMNMVEGKRRFAIHAEIPLMRAVYTTMFSEAHRSGNLEAMCNVRDAQDQSDPKVQETTEAIIEFEVSQRVQNATTMLGVPRCNLKTLPPAYISKFQKLDILNLSRNRLHEAFNDTSAWKLKFLNLSHNYFSSFPINLKYFPSLSLLALAHNFIKEVPEYVAEYPQLGLDVSYNLIDNLHPSLLNMNLDATGNPLTSVLPAYRTDKDKILTFLKNAQSQVTVEWNQVKLMIFGHEAVGKTTLLRAMQKEKFNHTYDVSTNGVNIVQLTLERSKPKGHFKKQAQQEQQQVKFSVWDFGGQSVFHSTHRIFITPFALYVVLYDMSKPETRERVRYWIDQIGADADFSKPILIVGTHADLLSKDERSKVIKEMEALYPTPTPDKANHTKIQGHCAVNLLSDKSSLEELINKLVDLALDHPKIGVRHVRVPKCIEMLQLELERFRVDNQYLSWPDYVGLFSKYDIIEEYIQDNTILLRDMGVIVWNNVPKLRDVVIINPQWLADAMAGVVSFMWQSSVAKNGGMIAWQKMKEAFKLKFPDSVHAVAISMLEFFEIIYKMRTSQGVKLSQNNGLIDEQMFFVPNLLSSFVPGQDYPAVKYWNSLEKNPAFVRRFCWNFFPAGFFPRLLLRLVHVRAKLLASWLDAAILLGKDGSECAFMRLSRESEDSAVVLEVQVKADETVESRESLVAQLAYLISQLHHDMYLHDRSCYAPLVHQIVVPHRNTILSFDNCIKAEIEGRPIVTVGGHPLRVKQFLPDLNGLEHIPSTAIQEQGLLGKGGFGEVYKGIMKSQDIHGSSVSIDVALKELQQIEETKNFYDFQHEAIIMSKLQHVNLVHLYGIVKAPLRMVLEYVPESDLHSLLKKRQVLSFKLKLKIALDCASGMSYLHSQSPPICHNDLRAPNLLVVSLDENADVIAKVADFGHSRQLFPFAQRTLHNMMETAPETWEGLPYDEKSDVFSYGIILWRLFGTKAQNGATVEKPAQDDEDEIDDSEREYLKSNGKYVPPPKQREIIRKGGRPPIHRKCMIALVNLIEKCWHISPDVRPSFTAIVGQLVSIYTSHFSEDSYILPKQTGSDEEDATFRRVAVVEYLFKHSVFQSHNWTEVQCAELVEAPTSVLELDTEVWFGTPTGGLAMFDKESSQFIQFLPLLNSESPRRSTKKTVLMSTDDNCVWAAVGSEIHVVSTVTRSIITLQLQNIYPITAMVFLPSKFVWVADTEGFVSIWDAQTLQKCYRFRIHPHNCAQALTVLHSYVCMAVGRELVAVHTSTLTIINAAPAHGDRIQDITAVPSCNQIWTCTRDGCVSAWLFSREDSYLNGPSSPPSQLPQASPPTPIPQSVTPSRGLTTSSSQSFPSPASKPQPPLPQLPPEARVRSPSLPPLPGAARVLPRVPSVASPPNGAPPRPSKPLPPRPPGAKVPALQIATLPTSPKTSPQTPSPRTPSPTSSPQSKKDPIIIQMKFKLNLNAPVKCACILSDGGHVCVGTFDGSIYAWNVQTFQQYNIPMPDMVKAHNMPCILDTEYGLWCSVEGLRHSLLFHRHAALSQQIEVLACRTHGRKFHDAFINYRVYCEGSKSLASPVEALYNALSGQHKKKSIGAVHIFWDEKCLNYGQNWERSFFHALTASKVVVLLISAQTLEGIRKNAPNKQDNVLVEYECAIMQNKLHKTPVIPVLVGGVQKDGVTGNLVFSPFDFKDLDPSTFPNMPHSRGGDIQFIVENMSKSMSANEQKFLKTISATMEQLGKLQGHQLTKRGTDEQELQKIVDQIMEEIEK